MKRAIKKKESPIYLWKSMQKGMKSSHGSIKWKKGKWFIEDNISICNRGFHASENVIHAMGYVSCEVLAKVEVRGEVIRQDDKQVWSEMRIVEAYEWTKEDSVNLAIYAAELVIDIYEKKYPNDDRPRKAIEAAKAYLKNPSDAAADAAYAAYAADAAYAAAYAARAAARAAAYAADAAYAAADAARAAAYAAAKEEILKKCHNYVLRLIAGK